MSKNLFSQGRKSHSTHSNGGIEYYFISSSYKNYFLASTITSETDKLRSRKTIIFLWMCVWKNEAMQLFYRIWREQAIRWCIKEILDILATKNVTYNYHRYCLTEEVLERNGLLSQWNILSTNTDSSGNEFISTLEHKTYPFMESSSILKKTYLNLRKKWVYHILSILLKCRNILQTF